MVSLPLLVVESIVFVGVLASRDDIAAADSAAVQCSQYDNDCEKCLISNDTRSAWASKCLWLSGPTEAGHRCQPSKWWYIRNYRYPLTSCYNCTPRANLNFDTFSCCDWQVSSKKCSLIISNGLCMYRLLLQATAVTKMSIFGNEGRMFHWTVDARANKRAVIQER